MDNSVSSHTQASTWTSTSGVRRAAALVDAAEDQYLHLAPMATPDQYLLTSPVTAEPVAGQLAVGTVHDGIGGAPTVRSPLSIVYSYLHYAFNS